MSVNVFDIIIQKQNQGCKFEFSCYINSEFVNLIARQLVFCDIFKGQRFTSSLLVEYPHVHCKLL